MVPSGFWVLQLVSSWVLALVLGFVAPFLAIAIFGLAYGESCAFEVLSPPGWEWVLVLVVHSSHNVGLQISTLAVGVHLHSNVVLLAVTVVQEVGTLLVP